MTGYQSKKAAARDKLIELAKEGMGMHSPDAPEYIVCEALIEALAQPEQEPVGFVDSKLNPIQRPWVGLTSNEWFDWWRVSAIADSTEAEIDFGDFLIIAQAVMAKLKDDNK